MEQKQIFEQQQTHQAEEHFIPKREFHESEETRFSIDEDMYAGIAEKGAINEQFERIIRPKPRWWKKLLGGAVVLFMVATVAQSVQWLVDSWAANQWIYFAFAWVALLVIIVGLSAVIKEWHRLVKLKKRMLLQQRSEQLMWQSAVGFQPDLSDSFSSKEVMLPLEPSGQSRAEQGKRLCEEIAAAMQIAPQDPTFDLWQKQIGDAHSAQEISYLFSQTVLRPFDQKVQKLISKNAAEAAVIVAVSPLALVDMFFIAWRNIRLINHIAKIYGIELGYFSRIRLLRMVLLNAAFAGASELVHEIGMDWLSQDLTAKLSARAAQGIGVGLLTARLGIKAMEFCRPLVFCQQEKPRLSLIHQELLSSLKSTIVNIRRVKEKDRRK